MNAGRQKIIEAIRQRLRNHREHLQRQLGVAWPDDFDESGDSGTAKAESLQLNELMLQEFRRTEEAMRQIREGCFGLCTRCQGEIAAERLELIPFATLCIPCQLQDKSDPESGSSQWN